MIRIHRLTVCLLLLAPLAGCSDDDRVLAKIGGKEVKQSEFDAYLTLKRIPRTEEKRRDAAFEEYTKRRALAQAIQAEGKLDQAVLDAEVEEYKKELLISRYLEKFLDDTVTDEAVQQNYSGAAAKYEEKKVHVAHILVRTDKRMNEEQRKAKLTTVQEIYSKLGSGGNFEELARQYSEDKISGSRGGDLGWIKDGTIDARFSERAFGTKAGAYTEPFETPFGFHILRVIEETKTIRRPLGAVAGEIRYRLRNEAKTKELARLEKSAAITPKKPYVLRPEIAAQDAEAQTKPSAFGVGQQDPGADPESPSLPSQPPGFAPPSDPPGQPGQPGQPGRPSAAAPRPGFAPPPPPPPPLAQPLAPPTAAAKKPPAPAPVVPKQPAASAPVERSAP